MQCSEGQASEPEPRPTWWVARHRSRSWAPSTHSLAACPAAKAGVQTALEEVTTSRHLNLFLPRIVFTRSICRRFPGQPLHFCSSLAAEFVCDAVRENSFSLPLPHVHTPSLRPRGFSFRLVATRQRSLLRRVHLLQYDITEKPKRPFASFKTFGTMHEAVRFLTLVPVTNLRRQSTASFVLMERLGLMLLFPPKFIRTISAVFGIISQIRIRILWSWKLFHKQLNFCLFGVRSHAM